MNLDKYECFTNETYTDFVFYSVGSKGKICKVVRYQKMRTAPNGVSVFNLSFGDWNDKKGKPDDTVISNNGDRDMVLATVASTIITFANKHGRCAIYAEGSIPSKTRLYQMGINAYWNDVQQLFFVFGLLDREWTEFKSGLNFKAFLVILK